MSIDNGSVILNQGVPAAMKFSAYKELDRDRRDPDSGFISKMHVLSFQVVELNGAPTLAIYDITSEKLASQIRPYLADPSFTLKTFTITRTGSGYATQYQLQVS